MFYEYCGHGLADELFCSLFWCSHRTETWHHKTGGEIFSGLSPCVCSTRSHKGDWEFTLFQSAALTMMRTPFACKQFLSCKWNRANYACQHARCKSHLKFLWWEHIFISGQRYILKSLTSKMSIKTPGPLCPLGPLLTRMIGNTPNAQNLGGSQFETCLCFFSRKSSSPGCICRVMCHIVICSMSIYIYICVCKNVIFHVICTDASRVMKANSPTFQDHLVDQHPRISANPATQSVSNTWPQHIFPCKLTICLFHAKVL